MKIARVAVLCLTTMTAGGFGFSILSIVMPIQAIAGCSGCR
ncbi:hypothetical protein ACVMHZ_002854 [Bradyrhizobium liaoningense]